MFSCHAVHARMVRARPPARQVRYARAHARDDIANVGEQEMWRGASAGKRLSEKTGGRYSVGSMEACCCASVTPCPMPTVGKGSGDRVQLSGSNTLSLPGGALAGTPPTFFKTPVKRRIGSCL